MYSPIPNTSEEHSYLVPNQDLRGVGQPYVKGGDFLQASLAVDPAVLSGSGLTLASIPSPISGKYIHLPDGNVSAPGLAWAGEITSGRYRIGAANAGESILGDLVFDWNATRLRLDSGFSLDITDMTLGSVLFAGTGGRVSQDNANFFWDDSNNRLGLLTTSPTVALDVNGDIRDRNMTGGSVLFADSTGVISQDNASFFWNDTSDFLKLESSLGKQLRLQYDSTDWADFTVDINGNLYFTLTTGPQWIFKAFYPLFNITGTGTNQPVSFRLTDNDTTLKSQLYYAGDAAAGDKATIVQNYGGDYLSLASNGSIRFVDKFLSTEFARFTSSTGYASFTPPTASTGTDWGFKVSGPVNTGGSNGLVKFAPGASTNQTLSTEINFIKFDMSSTTQWAAGAITSERAFYIAAPTLAFTGASTVTNAATVYIDQAPQAGTNATITNAYALWVDSGLCRFDGGITFSSFTQGSVLFAGSGGALTENNASLFWDNAIQSLQITSTGVGKDQSALTITYPVSSGGTGTNAFRIKRTSSPYDYDIYVRGGMYLATWLEVSGHAQNLGTANYQVLHPTSDSHMLGVWSDVDSAAVQIRCNNTTSPNRALDVVDAGAGTTYYFSINPTGGLQWGGSTFLLQDTNLYRSAADVLKTDDTFFAAVALQSPTVQGATTASANLTLQSTSHATKGNIIFGSSYYNEPTNRLVLGSLGAGNCRITLFEAATNGALTSSVRVINPGTGSGTGVAIDLGYADAVGSCARIAGFYDGTGRTLSFLTAVGTGTAQVERFRITPAGNISVGTAAILTTATDEFLYVSSCAGTPTGTPTTLTGRVPHVNDTTNDLFYYYSNSVWRTPVGQELANGQRIVWKSITELTTIAAAATTATAIQIPVDAIVLGVSVRVTVVIPTAATFTVTGTTSATQFDVAGGVSTAATTTDTGTRNCPYKNGAAQTITITPNVNPAANTGRVRVTIHYYQITPATS